MEPYRASNAKLTGGARFLRGFQRIGAGLAGLVIVVGLGATTFAAVSAVQDATGRYEQAKCIVSKQSSKQKLVMSEYRPLEVQFDESGCKGPGYSETIPIIYERAKSPPSILTTLSEPLGVGLIATAIAGGIVFVFCWLIGWICAGFTRD